MSHQRPGRARQSKEEASQEYEQFMQMRFHSFLAKKHASESKKPVQLLNIPSESTLKLPPRDVVKPFLGLHKVATKLGLQPTNERPQAGLCAQALTCLEDYYDSQPELATHNNQPTSHSVVLSYLKRCIYSDRPTSASPEAKDEDLSFIPFFEIVATHEQAMKDLQSKYDNRTAKNRALVEQVAELKKQRDELRDQFADQQ